MNRATPADLSPDRTELSPVPDSLNDFARDTSKEVPAVTDAETSDRYALSFTTGTLLTREAALLAPAYLEERDWEKARDRAVAEP